MVFAVPLLNEIGSDTVLTSLILLVVLIKPSGGCFPERSNFFKSRWSNQWFTPNPDSSCVNKCKSPRLVRQSPAEREGFELLSTIENTQVIEF
jgi:hypothetical protein